MRHSRFAPFLLALLFVAAPATARTPTVGEIRAFLTAHGGHETINRYFEAGEPGYDSGFRLVENGSREGIALAVDLLPYSSAHATESLLSALGTAMMHNPRAVLPLLGTDPSGLFDAAHLCAPFIGDDVGNARALAILARARRAIAAVHDPGLQAARQACLADIAKGVVNIRRYAVAP